MELTPQALQEEWRQGRFRTAYFLYGEDAQARLAALAVLRKAAAPDELNVSEFGGESEAEADDILSACSTQPMFAERRLVIVRRLRLGAAGRKKLAEYLRAPLASTVLVLLSDERRIEPGDALAAAAAAAGAAAGFKPLRPEEAEARLSREAKAAGLVLDPEAAQRMVEEAGSEWGILRAELEKLVLYCRGRREAGVADILACLGYRREANPFALADAVEARDARRALAALRTQLEEGTEFYALLPRISGALTRQLRAKRMLRSGAPPEQVMRELRIQHFVWPKFVSRLKAAREEALVAGLKACLRTEAGLKSKTWLDPGVELEQLVAGVCGAKAG